MERAGWSLCYQFLTGLGELCPRSDSNTVLLLTRELERQWKKKPIKTPSSSSSPSPTPTPVSSPSAPLPPPPHHQHHHHHQYHHHHHITIIITTSIMTTATITTTTISTSVITTTITTIIITTTTTTTTTTFVFASEWTNVAVTNTMVIVAELSTVWAAWRPMYPANWISAITTRFASHVSTFSSQGTCRPHRTRTTCLTRRCRQSRRPMKTPWRPTARRTRTTARRNGGSVQAAPAARAAST